MLQIVLNFNILYNNHLFYEFALAGAFGFTFWIFKVFSNCLARPMMSFSFLATGALAWVLTGALTEELALIGAFGAAGAPAP